MDSFDIDNVKAEKAKALRRFNRFRRIGRFFRAAEVCVALLFIFWTLTRLPFAVQISRVFLRRIAAVISTPLFVFLLGNSIVVVLLTKSSDRTTTTAAASAETEIYQAFVRSVENRSKPSDEDLTEEIVYDDKQVIVTDLNSNPNLMVDENIPDVEIDSDSSPDHPRKVVYGRSKSDVSGKQSPEAKVMMMMMMKRSLQRSETEKCCRETENDDLEEEEKNYPEDNLSNEEFQKTIEAFIAKQRMFRRQEPLAVVVHHKP
ncbi:unnamed protein product [Arabidopsis lyrata]|uniref:DUF4408 domain-containing protein n=1 Tax=Arabidopsis lyrata subsp. lyrata TaxID=81972 RepID=D7MMX9_ARALL|nr:uncharacterized protein LOC9302830 [Arabidopsis lyrata subsp. lyrata]EFH41328.1 hypothetical protein ARALYDRAFT_496962 [Arabidopsis lyrata subsp. lyrata]CAH8281100.1 unnamed protein product [Arabidopsis lyrata]|eukprot:XP_002865069.1 uncharacterized protein LOC9302830 [Arabidopsis lyrata subsp. lyrata]